ncbi:MAG: tRNA (N6-isopentenyl adenosine(37)-C2)-methylthiotransferase MiaB [Bacteroidia bacterium]|nr:tRNA (N6-isopentenyl adenosine(37)-C2)-methylthiotransferase MiaB [Bacteroidia bacterium]MDW8345642.1 tRNA (N6-isopentenyl adenosine(37)-C2)-methylthiotransferase MiaB [Bacteroidia bacterium]
MNNLITDIPILDDIKIHDESVQGTAFESVQNQHNPNARKLYIETYGCQMNFSDTEIVASIMLKMGFKTETNPKNADVIFLNTCSIRENAEQKVWERLKQYRSLKKHNPGLIVGVLGCMAERLKSKLLEQDKLVDIVVGPDAYRDLPNLISEVDSGQKAVNVLLSLEETYADISPVRLNSNGVSAFISIMRGCDNMCSFCVVPFTRGRERSREVNSILHEVEILLKEGYREVTLLGQNVDSYRYHNTNFAQLLELVAQMDRNLRVRFTTSHPKDISNQLLETMAKYNNICKFIHLPVQSGNNRILNKMNRTYTREWYLERVQTARSIMPNLALSTDIIVGFCSETEEEHQDTLSILEEVRYEHAYMFKYSERPGTLAARKYPDDVPDQVKTRRLNEVITLQTQISREKNLADIGKTFTVLVEGASKRSEKDLCGRNDANKMLVFPYKEGVKKGDYIQVKVKQATSATLIGEIVD